MYACLPASLPGAPPKPGALGHGQAGVSLAKGGGSKAITRVSVCVPWMPAGCLRSGGERQGRRAPAAKDFQHLVEVSAVRLTLGSAGVYSLNHPAPDQPPSTAA